MKGQRNFDMSGTSRLSLADAGLGAAAGFLAPVIVNRVVELYGSSSEFLSDANNRRLVAAAGGVVMAIPLYYWRGIAPALVAAVTALLYGAGGYVADWVNQLGTPTAAALGAGRQVGLLQQASRQVGALQQASSYPKRGMRVQREFAGVTD